MSYEITFTTDKPETAQLLLWLRSEWEYAHKKFHEQKPQHDVEMDDDGISEDSWWYNQFAQYIQRARILGLPNPNGRQQLAKCFATLSGCIESMIRVYGPLPTPRYPSGYVHTWDTLADELQSLDRPESTLSDQSKLSSQGDG